MDPRRGPLLLVCAGVALVLALGGGLAVAEETGNETAAPEMGQQVTAFTQASVADANATVERGMWEQQAVAAEQPERAVANRTGALEQRIDRLERRQADLEAAREDGTLSEAAYAARASQLRAQQLGLETDLNHTERTAQRVGVDVESLDTLRQDAHNMTGPEVAAVARNITDAPRGPPEDRPGAGPPDAEERGPPGDDAADQRGDDRPGQPDDSTATDDGDDEQGADDSSPPDDAGGPPNENATGPPG